MTQAAVNIRVIPARPEAVERRLPVLDFDRRTYDRALDCVHCGLCLPACPTYTQNGLEADSPRGRIYLMRGLADGRVEPTAGVVGHLDLCLDCRACETACPSGVVYHELIEEARTHLAGRRRPGLVDRLVSAVFFHVFPNPTRLKLAVAPVRLLQMVGLWQLLTRPALTRLLPAQIEKMQQMLPARGRVWEPALAERHHASAADGRRRATVALFAGCVGSVMFQHVNRQTIALLRRAGCDVVVPRGQRCCGAIHHHGGRVAEAEALARANIDAFAPDGAGGVKIDYVVNNIAGCGAMLRDYAHLLRDDPAYGPRAADLVGRCRDISELLIELDAPPPTHPVARRVTYHDACHLAHAQKVTTPPRKLLALIPGLELIDLPESDTCCGAAGTYNLSQPAMARDLAERKLGHIKSTGAAWCATGNVGCAMQIDSEARRLGMDLKVVHPVSLLHEACFG